VRRDSATCRRSGLASFFALEDRMLQRHFAADRVSWAARTYLSLERLSIE
jgi:hypothetical protein